MFVELLKEEQEQSIFLTLCFAVAIADPLDMEDKAKALFDKDAELGMLNDFLERSKLLAIFGMQNSEAELFKSILAICGVQISEQTSNLRVEDALGVMARDIFSVVKFPQIKGVLKGLQPFLEAAEEIYRNMPGTTLVKATKYPEIFKAAMGSTLSDCNFSVQKQKIMLFEMSNMAFSDGTCSDDERSVLYITGELFGLSDETIEEIIGKSLALNTLYNECIEIINE